MFSGGNMCPRALLGSVLVPACWFVLFLASDVTGGTDPGTAAPRPAVTAATAAVTNTSSSRGLNTTRSGGKSPSRGLNVDSSMIQRALYVLIGITMIGLLYFLIRAVRLKKPGQRKKYGLLSNYDDSVEMEAVESDEDDTLYEARSLRR